MRSIVTEVGQYLSGHVREKCNRVQLAAQNLLGKTFGRLLPADKALSSIFLYFRQLHDLPMTFASCVETRECWQIAQPSPFVLLLAYYLEGACMAIQMKDNNGI